MSETKIRYDMEPSKAHNGGHSTDGVDPLKVKAIYRRIIRPIRERARVLGYAIGVHGSLSRDIDLIAVPWTEEAGRYPQEALASHVRDTLNTLYRISLDGPPSIRGHGRMTWSWWIRPWTYVDFSVMPIAPEDVA